MKNFNSCIAPFIEEFVRLKEIAGISTRKTRYILTEIDNFYIEHNIQTKTISREIIEKWRKNRVNDGEGTLHNKYSVWAQLARFMSRNGFDCYIPHLPKYSKAGITFEPYIFTHAEIKAIFNQSENIEIYRQDPYNTLFCIPTILRLLYSTGVRISEALSIRNEDVKIEEHYIHIKKTKNGRERIVPINEDLHEVLFQYVTYRNQMPLQYTTNPKSLFFIKPDGSCCRYQAIYKWFRKILKKCGIPYVGNRLGPRVHDLRHTMAVHSLEQMSRNGLDLYVSLPLLSTCLGHKSLRATERYVRLTREIFPELSELCSPISSYVYPKFQNDDNQY